MHSARPVFAQFDCTGPLHHFFRYDVAAFVRLGQKERVIGVHPSAIAKPANAPAWNELMNPALNVDAEGVPGK